MNSGTASTDTTITIPPDGGWGWMVVIASFTSNYILSGFSFAFGVFLNEISTYFKVHPTDIAIAASIASGFCLFTGPFSCAIVNGCGLRITGFIGGIITGLAYFLSAEAPHYIAFIIIFGVVGGIGYGMAYFSSKLVVRLYFERRRSLANSLALLGSSVGIVTFPWIFGKGLEKNHWLEKFRFLGIGCMVVSFLAFFFRPIQSIKVLTRGENAIDLQSLAKTERSGNVKEIFDQYSDTKLPTALMSSSVISTSVSQDVLPETSQDEENLKEKETNCCKINTNRPMYRDDIFYSGAMSKHPHYHLVSHEDHSGLDYHVAVTRVETDKKLGKNCSCFVCCPQSILRPLVIIFNCHLLKSPSYVLFAFSCSLMYFGMFSPFMFLIQRAEESKFDNETYLYLYTTLGISHCLGKLLMNHLNITILKPQYVFSVSILISGLATILSYYYFGLYSQLIYNGVFGFTVASVYSMRAPILVDMLGLQNLTNAYGILIMFQGTGMLLSMPIAKCIYKIKKSYNLCFLSSGVVLTLSGILLAILPVVYSFESRKKRTMSE